MGPRKKARMVFPLYRMISMPVVHPIFKINILKMEQAFQTGYQEGDKMFYVSLFFSKGQEEFQEECMSFWNWHWMSEKDIWIFLTCQSWPQVVFQVHVFLFGMEITSCRLGYLTSTVYKMMNPLGTSLLIPLFLTPLMGLLNSSLPWWNSISMFLTLLLFPTLNLI